MVRLFCKSRSPVHLKYFNLRKKSIQCHAFWLLTHKLVSVNTSSRALEIVLGENRKKKSRTAGFKHIPLSSSSQQFVLSLTIGYKTCRSNLNERCIDGLLQHLYCTPPGNLAFADGLTNIPPCCSEAQVAVRCGSRCNRAYFLTISLLEMCLKLSREGSRRLLLCLALSCSLK